MPTRTGTPFAARTRGTHQIDLGLLFRNDPFIARAIALESAARIGVPFEVLRALRAKPVRGGAYGEGLDAACAR